MSDIEKEKEFMDITTSEKYVIGHFYHKDFRRCKIMDTHLEVSGGIYMHLHIDRLIFFFFFF